MKGQKDKESVILTILSLPPTSHAVKLTPLYAIVSTLNPKKRHIFAVSQFIFSYQVSAHLLLG